MYWNYRVVRKKYRVKAGDLEETGVGYGIHEVYYTEEGKVEFITEDPAEPHGETMEELKKDLKYMNLALEKEILKYEKIAEKD